MRSAYADVAIVGGGLAGLSAAAYLARTGRTVALFEQAASLGGRAATKRQGEYCFNRGIHALYTGGAASDLLRELGIAYGHGSPKTTYVLRNKRIHPFPAGPFALLGSQWLNVGDKLELMRLFMALPRLDPAALARVTIEAWLGQAARRPQVRQLLAAVARTFVYSAALDLVSADVFVDKLQRSLQHPVHYVDGGWQTLVDALRRAAEQAGARIVSGAHVAAIECSADRAVGVRLRDGSLADAGAVLIAASPPDVIKLLGRSDSAWCARLGALIPARLACLDVALRRRPCSRYAVVQDLDQPRFMSLQSDYARVAPAGAALVHSFKQLDPRTPGDPHADERELEDLLDTAIPGWRAEATQRAFLPQIAAAGALPTAATGGFAGRPGPRVPGLQNVYLAGDWVGPTGFLADASMASAHQAAQLILAGVTDASARTSPLAG